MAHPESTDVVIHILDHLTSEDESVRDAAWNQLGNLGVAAVPGLLDAIECAVKAEDAARAIRWLKLSRYSGFLLELIVLAWLVATGATTFGAPGALVAAIGALIAGLAFLVISLVRSNRIERAARRGAYAREVLKTITDVSAINPLADRLSRGHRIVSAEAAWALERLLGNATADDWNSVILPTARRKLAKMLVLSNADEHPRLLVSIFSVMARAGDTQAYYDIGAIARAKPTTATERLVVDAAADYLSEIEHSAGQQRDKSTLLRATDSAALNLLRPASPGDAAKTLLRPSADKSPHEA